MTGRRTTGNRRLHHSLGYAGLAPFVVCAAMVLLGHSPEIRVQALEAMMLYAAVVASFIGAVHWGAWLVEYPDTRPARLGWGVLPSLAGWALLFVPTSWALPGFIALYLVMAVVEREVGLCYKSQRAEFLAF